MIGGWSGASHSVVATVIAKREATGARRTETTRECRLSITHVDSLAALVHQERNTLLMKWRDCVRMLPSAKDLDTPTLNDHVADLIDALVAALDADPDTATGAVFGAGSPPAHGLQRVKDGFDIDEVVAEYGMPRRCIHDRADAHALTIQARSFKVLNSVLDGAVGQAVQSYAVRQATEVQARRDEHLAFVAHDLRTPLNAISLATKVLEVQLPTLGAHPALEQMLKTLRRNVQQRSSLVNSVLEANTMLLARTGVALERRSLDLWPLVEALHQDISPVSGTASTTVVNEVPHELVAYADANLLRRVFRNLMANAILYAPRGEVRIGARPAEAAGSVEAAGGRSRQRARSRHGSATTERGFRRTVSSASSTSWRRTRSRKEDRGWDSGSRSSRRSARRTAAT